MENLYAGDLTIKVTQDNSKVLMEWLGMSRERDPAGFLNPYLQGIVNELAGNKLVIDFRKFEYMNSSSVPPIVALIKELDNRGIDTTIYYDRGLDWQTASFKAISTITEELNSIKVEGK